jgi:hypothetical protein
MGYCFPEREIMGSLTIGDVRRQLLRMYFDQKFWKTPCLLLPNVAILTADVGGLSKRTTEDADANF